MRLGLRQGQSLGDGGGDGIKSWPSTSIAFGAGSNKC